MQQKCLYVFPLPSTCHESLACPVPLKILPGTKTPLRQFFCQLTVAERTAAATVAVPVSYKPLDVSRFPLVLKLVPVPNDDLGSAGVWNQYEFCKAMLSVSLTWDVRELSYHQSSLSEHVAVGYEKEGEDKIKGKRMPQQQAASSNEPDWSLFQDPLFLAMGNARQAHPPESRAGPVREDLPKHAESAEAYSELGSDHSNFGDEEVFGFRHEEGGVTASDSEDDAPRQQKSAKSSAQGQRAPKTDATDFDLVAQALAPRPGRAKEVLQNTFYGCFGAPSSQLFGVQKTLVETSCSAPYTSCCCQLISLGSLASVRTLPPKHRIYFQKAANAYVMFYNNKAVKGSVRHVTERGGGHRGQHFLSQR